MKTFTWYSLIELSNASTAQNQNDDLKLRFKAWERVSRDEVKEFVKIGTIDDPKYDISKAMSNGIDDYWGDDAKIVPVNYPYPYCGVFTHPNSSGYFLIYIESGGHIPENRCRYFDPTLFAD